MSDGRKKQRKTQTDDGERMRVREETGGPERQTNRLEQINRPSQTVLLRTQAVNIGTLSESENPDSEEGERRDKHAYINTSRN